jgi:hypothetical protein
MGVKLDSSQRSEEARRLTAQKKKIDRWKIQTGGNN